VLSNGQQFRVNLARTLAETPAMAVVDEFASWSIEEVAQIGSAAVAKTVRAAERAVRRGHLPRRCARLARAGLGLFEPATNKLTRERAGS
jgi:ABC-type phosphate transport system ATPase subunit